MTPVIPHSSSPISLVPGATFTTRKNSSLRRCCFFKNSAKRTSYAQDFILPLSASVRLFPHIRTCDLHRKPLLKMVSATGVDVAVEQPDSSVADQDSADTVEVGSSVESKEDSSIKSKRARPGRKSEMPPVKNEDLVSGATFTGKVRSIQPFGAFVDFGAFTDGLIHVSQLSDNFVKDVGAVVSVGQEVQVRLLEASTETGRISLSMRTSDSTGTANRDRKGPPRRNTQNSNQKRDRPGKGTTSKLVQGQELVGTVKNFARSGAFISLPEGEEGFLPQSEEAIQGLGSNIGKTSLEIGQKVSVRVLRITRGQATLTMKKEETNAPLELEIDVGTEYAASRPFLLAFRKNKELSAFLDEREKQKEKTESLKSVESAVLTIEEESVVTSDILSPEASVSSVDQVTETAIGIPEVVEVKSDGLSDKPVIEEVQIEIPISEAAISSPPPVEIEKAEADSDESSNITGEVQTDVPGDESEISLSTPIEITSEAQIQTPDADVNSIISSSQEIISEV